jgi:hypothetical protein
MLCPTNFLSDVNPPQLMAISVGLNQAVEIWWDYESASNRDIVRLTGLSPPWCMGEVSKVTRIVFSE